MTMSDAERAKNYRDRKKERDGTVTAVPDLPPDGKPGMVAEALEHTIAGISSPDPLLCALARRLAAHMDASGAGNHQLAAELRRTVNDLRGRSRVNAARSGLSGGRKRTNKVAELRGEYQAGRMKRAAG